MSKNYVKVGIVGCGFITQQTHIPAFRRVRSAQIVALCDQNESLATSIARVERVPRVYTSLTDMVRKEQLDLVDICTPIQTHFSLAAEALKAGCHVLVEKPMALTVIEAEELEEIANNQKLILCVMHNMLFLPVLTRMKRLIQDGYIGQLLKVHVVQGCPPSDFPPVADPNHWYHKLPGGIHGDNLPHPIYIARHFIGSMDVVKVIVRKSGSLHHLAVDDVQIILKGDHADGIITSSCNLPSLWTVDIYGTKRALHADLINSYLIPVGTKTKAGKGIPSLYFVQNMGLSLQILACTGMMGFLMMRRRHTGHANLIRRLIESIERGTEAPVTAQDGLEVVRLWEKVTQQIPTDIRYK